jgi:type IV pilus assembly protein PilC
MARFRFEAVNEQGAHARGFLSADSEQGLAERLLTGGWKLVTAELQEEQPKWFERLARGYFSFLFHRVGARSLALWYRSLSYLLRAGVSLSEAAHTLGEKCDNSTLRAVSRKVARAAREGKPMNAALQDYPGAFPAFARAVMEVGQQTGNLEKTSASLAQYYDQIYALQAAYRSQLAHPFILLAFYILIPVLPVWFFGGFGAFVLALIARTARTAIILILLVLVWKALIQWQPFAQAFDRFKLSLPLLGGIFRKAALSRWARSMAMLFSAGVGMAKAAEVAAGACGNAAIEAAVRREVPRILEGQPLSAAMKASGEFPDTAVEMAAAGEQSGELDEMLTRVAGYYEAEVMTGQRQTVVSVVVALVVLFCYLMAALVIRFWAGYYAQLPKPGH